MKIENARMIAIHLISTQIRCRSYFTDLIFYFKVCFYLDSSTIKKHRIENRISTYLNKQIHRLFIFKKMGKTILYLYHTNFPLKNNKKKIMIFSSYKLIIESLVETKHLRRVKTCESRVLTY